MKKAINLIITYLLLLFIGWILGSVIYSIYLNSLNYVSGNRIKFFSLTDLVQSGIYVAYCLIFLICPVISYYRGRHPAGISQTIAYVLICLFTWGVLFPGVYYTNKAVEKKIKLDNQSVYLSEGYFRAGADKIYLFTKPFDDYNNFGLSTSGVVIDTTENGTVKIEKELYERKLEIKKHAYPYKEVQQKDYFAMKGKPIPVDFALLINKAKTSFENGFFRYLNFLSLALLICILYGISNFFEWRLLNTTLIFFITTIILSINSIYYSSALLQVKHRIMQLSFFQMLNQKIDEPIIFVLNNFITLVFVIIGIVRLILKTHKGKNK